MSEWGLPSERDSNGNLRAVEHEYEYQGEDVKIKLYPPTVSQLEEYEELGDDTSATELADIVDQHLVKPDVDDPTIQELFCFVQGIVDYGAAGGTDFVQDAREELEKRQSDEGN